MVENLLGSVDKADGLLADHLYRAMGEGVPEETSPGGRINFRGGDWSSYGYNGHIYESDTRRGLYVWNVSAPEARGPTVHLDYLNPQTNHLSFPAD